MSAALYAAVFFCSQGAREDVCRREQRAFELGGERAAGFRGNAGSDREGVDKLEDEEAGEGTA